MSIINAIRGEARTARRDATNHDAGFADPGREIQPYQNAVASRRSPELDALSYASDIVYPGQQAYYAPQHHAMQHHMPEHAMNLLDRRPAGGQRGGQPRAAAPRPKG